MDVDDPSTLVPANETKSLEAMMKESESEGEDEDGLVSKSYKLRHPEIEWVHRGQGRYRRAQPLSQAAAVKPRKPETKDSIDKSFDQSMEAEDVPDPNDLVDKAYTTKHPEIQWQHQGRGRYRRRAVHVQHLRIKGTHATPAGSADEEDNEDDDEDVVTRSARRRSQKLVLRNSRSLPSESDDEKGEDEADVKYSKAERDRYLALHPGAFFRHVGNGRYRRKGDIDDDGDQDVTYSRAERDRYMEKHPHETFRHVGNGRFRRTPRTTDGIIAQSKREIEEQEDEDAEAESQAEDEAFESADEGSIDEDKTYKVDFVNQYKARHPEAQFRHTGNGWYRYGAHATKHPAEPVAIDLRRKSSPVRRTPRQAAIVQTRHTTPADSEDEDDIDGANADAIFTKEQVERFLRKYPKERGSFNHRGNGRYKRVSRPLRRGPSGIFEEDESEDEIDYNEDPEATFTKDQIDRYLLKHPDYTFHHRGNGRYKRGPPPSGKGVASNFQRPYKSASASVAAFTVPTRSVRQINYNEDDDDEDEEEAGAETEVEELDPERIYTKEYKERHPDSEFHHVGNGRYKVGPDPRRRASNVAMQTMEAVVEPSDEEDEDATWTRDQVNDYKVKHPNAVFHHRGNGRYKKGPAPQPTARVSVPELSPTPSQEDDDTTFSKAYVLRHPDEEFHHRGNARYKRGPHPNMRRQSTAKKEEDTPALPSDVDESQEEFVSKDYMRRHPEQLFHPRGTKWTRGPEPGAMQDSADQRRRSSNHDGEDENGLGDATYVEAHPEEEFHHRGFGRWRRGPKPARPSEALSAEAAVVDDKEDQPPSDIDQLCLRSEGPDKFPHLEWHYVGGGRWRRGPKRGKTAVYKRKSEAKRLRVDSPSRQLEIEQAAAMRPRRKSGQSGNTDLNLNDVASSSLLAENNVDKGRRPFARRKKSGLAQVLAQDSIPVSRAPTPPPPKPLAPEEDVLGEIDFPPTYRDVWPTPDPSEQDDKAAHIMKLLYKPLTGPRAFVEALTKHDPAVRPSQNLYDLAENVQAALEAMQDEYLELEKITAQHAPVARRPQQGGRLPIDYQTWEDHKEADLYDYVFDPRKVGYQDPMAQKVVRDAQGRELRTRRARDALDPLPVPSEGEEETGPGSRRRQPKPVQRFDGVVGISPRKRRSRLGIESATPDPAGSTPNGYVPAKKGRWAGHIPKHLRREMRAPSATSSASEDTPAQGSRDMSADSSGHKGRPFGSKNLHRRKDAGIPKGPRKSVGMGTPLTQNALSTFEQMDGAYDNAFLTPDDAGAGSAAGGMGEKPKRKQRQKSEKRSKSMEVWWAKRKAEAEAKRAEEAARSSGGVKESIEGRRDVAEKAKAWEMSLD